MYIACFQLNQLPPPELSNNNLSDNRSFFALATQLEVVITAMKVAVVVGTILTLINHVPAYMSSEFSRSNLWQIMLTYLVPYFVSTYSSVKMMRRFIK